MARTTGHEEPEPLRTGARGERGPAGETGRGGGRKCESLLLRQGRRPPAFRPRPPARAAAGAGSTPERRSCLRGEIKGPHRSARRHAFCMRKTLSKRHLGRKKEEEEAEEELGNTRRRLQQHASTGLSVKPGPYLRFSSLPFSPSSSSPAQNVEKQQEEEEEEKKEGPAAGVCLMAAASPLENSQVACELFRRCGESAAHGATPPANRQPAAAPRLRRNKHASEVSTPGSGAGTRPRPPRR